MGFHYRATVGRATLGAVRNAISALLVFAWMGSASATERAEPPEERDYIFSPGALVGFDPASETWDWQGEISVLSVPGDMTERGPIYGLAFGGDTTRASLEAQLGAWVGPPGRNPFFAFGLNPGIVYYARQDGNPIGFQATLWGDLFLCCGHGPPLGLLPFPFIRFERTPSEKEVITFGLMIKFPLFPFSMFAPAKR